MPVEICVEEADTEVNKTSGWMAHVTEEADLDREEWVADLKEDGNDNINKK